MSTYHVDSERSQEVIAELLHWIWSSRLQIDRLIESTRLEWAGDLELTSLEQGRQFSRTSYDEHLVLVAGNHLVAAVEIVGTVYPQFSLDPELSRQMTLLRHVYEHWNDLWKAKPIKALEKFETDFPLGRARSIDYMANDWKIGGVVLISELSQLLDALETAALPLSRWADDEET